MAVTVRQNGDPASPFPVLATFQRATFMFCPQKSIQDVKEGFVKEILYWKHWRFFNKTTDPQKMSSVMSKCCHKNGGKNSNKKA
jgi:hypothetical protein